MDFKLLSVYFGKESFKNISLKNANVTLGFSLFIILSKFFW